ncbi:hypothetical protein [Streptomyces sp. NPDC048623]|uniref:hypothetical protein n=1 Tax=Streptomyces sp. NPDC048623 TaxID=3155761 RepID=UPI0034385CCF
MRYKALAVAAAAIGTIALGTAPASAAQNWGTVSTNSNWNCGAYKNHSVSDYVSFKICVVRNANNDAQTVLVVQNRASVAVAIGGEVQFQGGGHNEVAMCAASTLNPGYTRGCYGPTYHVGSSIAQGKGWLELNTVWNDYGQWISN